MRKRRTHSPEFKARVGMGAISGRKTIQEIAADHAIHPIQVSQWKKQLLDGSSELFTRGKKSKVKEAGQIKKAELFQQIGKLQMELEWLKRISAALMPIRRQSENSSRSVNFWACYLAASVVRPALSWSKRSCADAVLRQSGLI